MPGGVSYLVGSLTVNGTQRYDITEWSVSLSADNLFNRADGRKYPQHAASVNHSARLSITGYDLTNAAQSGSSAPLVGTVYNNGVVLSVAKNVSGNPFVITMAPAIVMSATHSGSYGALAQVQMEFEAVGSGGTEPVVSAATAS